MDRMGVEVAVIGTGWCGGIRAETLPNAHNRSAWGNAPTGCPRAPRALPCLNTTTPRYFLRRILGGNRGKSYYKRAFSDGIGGLTSYER